MAWWIYKCNNQIKWHGERYIGDWQDFFDECGRGTGTWGAVSMIPQLGKLEPGDSVLAYQTERNELVGLLEMVKFLGDAVRLRVVEQFGVKVRSLKDANPAIAAIPALQRGPIQTLRPLSAAEAKLLLAAARRASK